MKLLQVVAKFNPEQEGVSAVAAAVAQQLESDGKQGAAVVELGDRSASTGDAGMVIHRKSGDSRGEELLKLAEHMAPGDALLLHYVGYAYQARGVPFWLAAAWERVRQERRRLRLGVVFHEVYATGVPWQSAFWLMAFQRSIARRLLEAADVAVTSLPRYRELLTAMAPRKTIDVLPIPSTVGEPGSVVPVGERQRRLAVFGSAVVRERAYRRERGALARTVKSLGLQEILDIGGGEVAPAAVAGVPVRAVGHVRREEVSRLLLDSRAGFLAYPPDYLDKSTVYGAYLAHGLVPVCAWRGLRGRSARPDEVWLRATRAALEGGGVSEAAAARARDAYASRSTARHAGLWRERLCCG